MAEPVSALQGARFDGFARIEDAGPRGMITLRGDLSGKGFQKAATDAAGTGFPDRGKIIAAGGKALAWMSPDELLLMCPYGDVPPLIDGLTKALAGTHHLIADVSDARAQVSVSGADAREVIAKLCPADLAPGSFGPGQFRRSRLAQVPAAFWMSDEATFQVICFRSVARYVFDLLSMSAQPGSEAGYF